MAKPKLKDKVEELEARNVFLRAQLTQVQTALMAVMEDVWTTREQVQTMIEDALYDHEHGW